ncbi:hypothetical protein GCM10023189_43730 [Nibrella saemangeumensis]|uniref:Methyltransferase FkbM domain-containing protein n=1 Tax=Nibrella saemangeumensis TaxID=1084526 RepID=A0ABP8NEI5_9BACT
MFLARFLFKDAYRSVTNPNGREFLRLLLRYADRKRYVPTEVAFDTYQFNVPDALSFVWQYKEIFVDEFYRFNTQQPAPVIFDCGANIGMSVAYFRKQYPNARVVAFEADPKISAILQQNLSRNQIANLEVVNKAVWVNNDGILFGSEAADSSSIYSQSPKSFIPSVRLHDYLVRESRIDMLKIDIEGAETDVLDDCRHALSHVQNLFVEFHSYIGQPQSLGRVVQIIEENGFRYYVNTYQDRKRPFINHQYANNPVMDLQLNIFAWRP